jgi:hypothetical protein
VLPESVRTVLSSLKWPLTVAKVVVVSFQWMLTSPVTLPILHGLGGCVVSCVMLRLNSPNVGAPGGQAVQVAPPDALIGQPASPTQPPEGFPVLVPVPLSL